MNLEAITLSEVSQMRKDKDAEFPFHVESKISALTGAGSRTVPTRGWGGDSGRCWPAGAKLHVFEMNSSGELMYNSVTLVNSIVYMEFAKWVDPK